MVHYIIMCSRSLMILRYILINITTKLDIYINMISVFQSTKLSSRDGKRAHGIGYCCDDVVIYWHVGFATSGSSGR